MRYFLLLFLLLSFATTPSFAALLGPAYSYSVLSRDGSRILLMPGEHADEEDAYRLQPLPNGGKVDVHRDIAGPGVYDARSLELLWPMPKFDYHDNVLCAQDLSSVVHLNRFALYGGRALTFWNQGKVVKTYEVDDLAKAYRVFPFFLSKSVNSYAYWCFDHALSADHQKLKLSTARRGLYLFGFTLDLHYQEHYEFDLTTGNIVAQYTTGALWPWLYLVLLLAFVIGTPLSLRLAYVRTKCFIVTRRNTRRGLCPTCGYDLRAHAVGERCPECGTIIAQPVISNRKD